MHASLFAHFCSTCSDRRNRIVINTLGAGRKGPRLTAVAAMVVLVLVPVLVLMVLSITPVTAVPGDQSFLSLEAGFTQELIGVDDGFMGGVAFAPDGDPIVTKCIDSGSSLRRFDLSGKPINVNMSELAPITEVTSKAGCGLTSHPNGSLYSNVKNRNGVTRLDPDTGVVRGGPFGSRGNGLGITVNPLSGMIVYVGDDGTLYEVDPELKNERIISTALRGKFLDGIYFSPTGRFVFAANRTDWAVSIVDTVDGALIRTVPLGHEPDGIAFHAGDPQFVVTVNLDGTMSRLDFPSNEFFEPPDVSLFASGGFRGDLAEVGPDGCLYLTQAGVRYANGVTGSANSLVKICGGFTAAAGTFLDRDGDGLLDQWEQNGVDTDGDGIIDVDLPAMGSDPNIRDIFIEIDWISSRPADHKALAMVVEAFANAPEPIALHIDAGPRSVMRNGATKWGNLSDGEALSIGDPFGSVDPNGSYNWDAFQEVKEQNFDPARHDVFHYVIYAGSHPVNNGILGMSRGIPASDFVVFTDAVGNSRTVEAVNFMHELGHNLDLHHGGDNDVNRKPNYLSVMNYLFSVRGLIQDDGSLGVLDYSESELEDLNENALNESEGLTVLSGTSPLGTFRTSYRCPGSVNETARTGGSIDWNCSQRIDRGTVSSEINGSGGRSTLSGYNDWEGLRFNGGLLGANEAISSSPRLTRVDEDYDREVLEEFVERPFALVSDETISPIAIVAGGTGVVEVGFRSEGEFADSVVSAAAVDIRGVSATVDPGPHPIAAGGERSFRVQLAATPASAGSGYLWVEVMSQTDASEVLSWVAPIEVVPTAETCPSAPLPFTDVSAASFAKADIECIYGLGITEGKSATTYGPSENVTLWQMALFLARTVRSVGVECPTASLPFTDVSVDAPGRADIECVYGLGIMTGTSATTFSPSGSVIREQMALFLARTVRSVGVECPTASLPFTDVSVDASIRADIACIYGLGITVGTDIDKFSPSREITREQMAVFLATTWRIISGTV